MVTHLSFTSGKKKCGVLCAKHEGWGGREGACSRLYWRTIGSPGPKPAMATQKEDKRADDIMLASIYYFEEETTVFYENQCDSKGWRRKFYFSKCIFCLCMGDIT